MTLYKVLGPQAESIHGGAGTWHKPSETHPGKWMPAVKDVKCCKRGYHLVELDALPEWLRADCTIWEAEGKGASHTDGTGKTAFAQARLLKRLYLSERDLRLCAADFSEHVLHIFERTDERCTIHGTRADSGDELDVTWTLDDAIKAGVASKRNWQTYPRAMLDARATTEIARALFSDCIGWAVYAPEDFTEVADA